MEAVGLYIDLHTICLAIRRRVEDHQTQSRGPSDAEQRAIKRRAERQLLTANLSLHDHPECDDGGGRVTLIRRSRCLLTVVHHYGTVCCGASRLLNLLSRHGRHYPYSLSLQANQI